MRRVPVLLLAVLLPGCAQLLGGCGPHDQAHWTQEGIYAELPAAAARAGVALDETPAPPGIPADLGALGDAYPDATLASVAWKPDADARDRHAVTLRTEGARVLVDLVVPVDEPEEDVRADFRAFAANLTAADGATLDAWEERLIASRNVVGWTEGPDRELVPIAHGYQVEIDAPLRLDEALRDATPRLADGSGTPGHLLFASGAWALQLTLPVRELRLDTDSGPLTLRADPAGQASAGLARAEGTEKAAGVQAIRDGIARAGLTPPDLGPEDVATMVC